MKEYMEDLSRGKLFCGIGERDIEEMLSCLCAKQAEYRKGDFIIEEGSLVYDLGIILRGHGRAVKWDLSGRLIIITLLEKGSETGAVLAAGSGHKSPVTVEAQEDVAVLQIPFERILKHCKNDCPRHERLLRNYISIVSQKALVLHERIDCLLRPTVRDKVIVYLWHLSREQQTAFVTVPMDRNAMSEYLNVDRSALSRELSSMKKDGLINYHKNRFRLL